MELQLTHQNPTHWPLPLGNGVLVEVDFGRIETQFVELLDGGLRNLSTATVRAVSPYLSEAERTSLLPQGTGSFGARILTSEPNLRYLERAEYQACGLTPPDPEVNHLGDLAFINYERIIAVFDNNTPNELPFSPLGNRVFFKYDLDDQSMDVHTVGESGLVMLEKDLAVDNQLATVIGVGPLTKYLKTGDRVIVRRHSSSINYEGVTYFFVGTEHEIFAVLSSTETTHA